MARFYPLRVTAIRRETRDAVAVTLEPEAADADTFQFIQGQYLTFRRTVDGEEIRRSYSICSGTTDEILRVGIKKVDGGCFSSWANDQLAVGDVLEAMPPMGNFHAPINPDGGKHYAGFAGGSGITPVLGIIRTVLALEPKSSFTLIYGNRSANAIMFREEIEDLKNTYLGRLSVIHVLERESQEIDLFNGRVDRAKCEALFEHWVDVEAVDMAFICGPEPMMLAVAAALRDHGLDDGRIKFELFASSQPGRAPKRAAAAPSPTRGPGSARPPWSSTAVPASSACPNANAPSWRRLWPRASTRPSPARRASARPAGRWSWRERSKWRPTTRSKTTRFGAATS